MINEVIEMLKTYTDGKDNAGKVEISVMQLNRIIKALDKEPTDAVDRVTIKEYLYNLGMGIKVTATDDVLNKIRTEIDEQYDRVHPYNISCAEGLEIALGIIDKYMAEGSEKE